jgi:hypothetical protein
MSYYDNPGTNPDEAINIVNGKVFNVVQLADTEGNVVDPGSGGGTEVGLSPTTASVASSTSSVTILASNANRKGFSVCNISTSKLYLSFTSPADIENCFIEIPAGAFILLDQQLIVPNAIYGFWASSNGAAQVTEYV